VESEHYIPLGEGRTMKRKHKKPKARSPMAPPEIRMKDRRREADKKRCRGRVLWDDIDMEQPSPACPEAAGPRELERPGSAPHPTSRRALGGGIDEQVGRVTEGGPEAAPVFGGSVLGAAPAGLLQRIVAEE